MGATTSLVIETKRLRLRPIATQDAEAHALMMSDPEIARYLIPGGRPRGSTAEWFGFAAVLGHWRLRGFGFFSIEKRNGGEWIGRVGPLAPDGWPGVELAWSVARPYWGRGYATEAAAAIAEWLFASQAGLQTIVSLIAPDNVRSQAVARKLGERKTENTFEFAGFNFDVWRMDRNANT